MAPDFIDRRTFLAGSVISVAVPLVARAQQAGKIARIGILGNVPTTDREGATLWGAFVDGLRDLGYVEGQNIAIEWRSSEGRYDRLGHLAADLVRLKVDVIVVPVDDNARAARQATRTIPIIVANLGDPVNSGLIASVARPGGNVTGLSLTGPELAGKQVQLLKELLPAVSRLAILVNPNNATHPRALREASAAMQTLRVELQTVEARTAEDLDVAFAALATRRSGGLLVPIDGMFLLNRARIADLATKRRVPTMYGQREHVDAGGLAFYGASLRDSFRRAATYVDKILKGAHPGDLPIEQPTKYELVINLKTAKALGLTIPQSLLVQADEVIE